MYHVLQGVKGALGDAGLPGPTGIRGEFGERVSLTCCDDMKWRHYPNKSSSNSYNNPIKQANVQI